MTAAAPPMSSFISHMPSQGLMLIPPVSKVTPLPTKISGGWCSVPAGACSRMINWASCSLPRLTASRMFILNSRMAASSSTENFNPVAARPWLAHGGQVLPGRVDWVARSHNHAHGWPRWPGPNPGLRLLGRRRACWRQIPQRCSFVRQLPALPVCNSGRDRPPVLCPRPRLGRRPPHPAHRCPRRGGWWRNF